MLAWKIRLPSLEKLLSCGESPDGKRATICPLRVSITSTVRALEVRRDLRHPLRPVGNDVEPLQALEAVDVDQVDRAVPVVADREDAAQGRGTCRPPRANV